MGAIGRSPSPPDRTPARAWFTKSVSAKPPGAKRRGFPFGESRWQSGSDVNPYGFTDQLPEAFDLVDYDARYYDPLIGRFLSADSIVPDFANPQSLNRYAYALNNPIKYNDPSGHCVWDACIVEAILIGATVGALIGGGTEYAVQAIDTYQDAQDFSQAMALDNKDWGQIGVGAGVGAVSGGVTGGVGGGVASIECVVVRQGVKIGTSAAINTVANTSYVGLQSLNDGATVEQAVQNSSDYIQQYGTRDMVVGGVSSVAADIMSGAGNAMLDSNFSSNPYHMTSSLSIIK